MQVKKKAKKEMAVLFLEKDNDHSINIKKKSISQDERNGEVFPLL